MKGVNHLKVFGIVLFVFISLITIGYTMNNENLNPLPERMIKDGVTVVQGGYNGIVEGVKRIFTNVYDLFHTYEENKVLKQEMYNYESLNVYTNQLEEQIESLENLLDTGKSLTSYSTINATTVVRNVDQWHDYILINKGNLQGIEQNMAVLSKDGFLIGKVISVNETSSKVKLIKNQDFGSKVSAVIDGKENSIGTVEGYDYLTDELVMTQVSKDVEVEMGDAVMTSGLGGVYPRGLLIGNVDRIEISKDGLTQTLYLKGEENYNNMDYVIVVNREAVTPSNE
ncbi:MAG TPA: rod shape-determining protein MreC [Firmicutes bacterium]|nr:rod shape-determining protein MreC [Bacillota bacterium]